MKKSASKLIMFGAFTFVFFSTSCKTGSGYGCDYTEAKAPSEQIQKDSKKEIEIESNYSVTRYVTE